MGPKRVHLYLASGKHCSLLSFCVCICVSNMQGRSELAKTRTMSRRGRCSSWSMPCTPWRTRSTTWTRTSVPTTRGSAPRWSTREAKSCSSTSAALTSTVSWETASSVAYWPVYFFFHLISPHSVQINAFFNSFARVCGRRLCLFSVYLKTCFSQGK